MMPHLLLLIVTLFPTPADAQVNKCIMPDGRTVYQQEPCQGEGSELRMDTRDTGAGGLRDSEQQMLDEMEQTEDEQQREQAVTAQQEPTTNQCRGFVIRSVSPYTIEHVDKDRRPRTREIQCAEVDAEASGFYGKLLSDVRDQVLDRFEGVLANGGRQTAQTADVSGPERIGVRSQVRIDICFGVSDHKLSDVVCR